MLWSEMAILVNWVWSSLLVVIRHIAIYSFHFTPIHFHCHSNSTILKNHSTILLLFFCYQNFLVYFFWFMFAFHWWDLWTIDCSPWPFFKCTNKTADWHFNWNDNFSRGAPNRTRTEAEAHAIELKSLYQATWAIDK